MARGPYVKKTHCRKNHEFTPENTYTDPSGHRNCRQCIRDRSRRNLQVEMACPDCGAKSWVRKYSGRKDRTFQPGVCRSCAMRRIASGELDIFVTESMRQWWRDRFTPDEIHRLAAGLIPTAKEPHNDPAPSMSTKWDPVKDYEVAA